MGGEVEGKLDGMGIMECSEARNAGDAEATGGRYVQAEVGGYRSAMMISRCRTARQMEWEKC